MKKIIGLITIIIGLYATTSTASAYSVPSFPSCQNPQGDLKVRYDTGTHGIPGRNESFTGSDAVFYVSNITLAQCFCPDNGNTGIQTNWWKVPSLEEGMVDSLQKDGWIYIPDGSLWGLDATNYFAKNNEYSCRPTGGGNGPSNSTSNNGGVGGGTVQAATTAVMGLATTGNSALMVGILLLGVFLLIAGILVYKVKSSHQ